MYADMSFVESNEGTFTCCRDERGSCWNKIEGTLHNVHLEATVFDSSKLHDDVRDTIELLGEMIRQYHELLDQKQQMFEKKLHKN